MELVLGLAALATAVSSVGGANYIKDDSNIIEAETATVQTLKEKNIREVHDLPESRIGEGFSGIRDEIIFSDLNLLLNPDPGETTNNNYFDGATEVGEYNYDFSSYVGNKPNSYDKTFNGYISEEEDVDIFKFTLYGKANVTITLGDIPAQNDYDIELYEQGNGLCEASQRINLIKYSNHSGNTDEFMQGMLYPNTYYIKVYSYHGYGSPYYEVGLNVTYLRNDESITTLKQKGARGALWLSDYDPYGIQPSISDHRTGVGSVGSITVGSHYAGHVDTTHFTYPIQTGEYKHATLYIWNEEFRVQMFNLASRLYDAIDREIQDEREFRLLKQTVYYEWGGIITICSYAPYAGVVISLISDTYDLISGAMEILCPSEDTLVTKSSYLEYLSRLEAALDMYRPLPGSDITAFKIDINYHIVKKDREWTFFTDGTTFVPRSGDTITTNYYLTYQPVDPRHYFGYYQDTIYAQDPNNPITGTIYPIVDGNSMHKALARETYDMSYEVLNNNGQKSLSLNRGEYKWYKFTAPQNGTYYFMSKGDEETTIDIFGNMVYGKSDIGRVSRYYKNNGISTGVNFSLSLGEGQTIYLRVSGGNGAYSALSSTTLKISNTRFPSVFARINAFDLEVPMNLDNPFFFNFISVGNQYNLYVSSVGAFYNTDRGAIELLCDRDNNKPFAFIIMLFDRPIKEINFGSCIGNSYSYAHLGLYLQGLNQYGFPVTEDVVDTYCDDHLLPCGVRYDNRDEAIYGVMFRIDPETDTSPYHVGYQEQRRGDFVVEIND